MATKHFLSTALVALLGYSVFRYLDKELTPVVTLSTGDAVGVVARSREGREFFKFLGIPYGKPPVGELRFEPPQPAERWEGTHKATSFGGMCTHVNSISRTVEGQEDCLYLNVFTPKFAESPATKPLLPVLVYIHGGYFMAGGSNYMGPHYLMEENIILVTINYRLSSAGFLNTEDGTVLGNMGMKDQVLALRFVQREIAQFGGDKTRVVLWGESAGAAAVHFHLLSPMSKGLFSKAIMASGTAIKPWSLVNQPRKQAEHLAKSVNCPTNDSAVMVDCLRGLDSVKLAEAHLDALDSPLMDPLKIFAPSIEVKKSPETFLAEHPYDILKQGKAHRVPLLTGVNSHEGLLATARIYHKPAVMKEVEENWDELSPVLFCYKSTATEVTSQIKEFYLGQGEPPQGEAGDGLKFLTKFTNFTNLFSDRWYIHSMKETVRLQAAHSQVYLYYFSYPLERGLTFFYDLNPVLPISVQIVFKVVSEWVNKYIFHKEPLHLGTCHGDELVLLYNFPMVYVDIGDKDYELSRQLVQAFVQFAYDDTTLTLGDTPWIPVNTGNTNSSAFQRLQYMYIGNDTARHGTFIEEPFADRMDFWDRLNISWKMNT